MYLNKFEHGPIRNSDNVLDRELRSKVGQLPCIAKVQKNPMQGRVQNDQASEPFLAVTYQSPFCLVLTHRRTRIPIRSSILLSNILFNKVFQ